VSRLSVFVDGMQGTTGLHIHSELRQYEDDFEIISIDPDRRKDPVERARLLNEADIAVLCLPDAASRQAVAMIDNPRTRVLDASSAHRVSPGWVYGLPELGVEQQQAITTAARVSNPGCYPTGAILLLEPLVRAGVLDPDSQFVVHAVSGYSGGGRERVEAFEDPNHPEHTTEPYHRYGLFAQHKHVPEMAAYSGLRSTPLFLPAYGSYRQGILLEIPLLAVNYLRALPAGELRAIYQKTFAADAAVFVLDDEQTAQRASITPTSRNGTNEIELSVVTNDELGYSVLTAVYDNLGKGASRAAVQNLLLMADLADRPASHHEG
jgi:N-acetyl-gamma-glutamyl-phosphate reductase